MWCKITHPSITSSLCISKSQERVSQTRSLPILESWTFTKKNVTLQWIDHKFLFYFPWLRQLGREIAIQYLFRISVLAIFHNSHKASGNIVTILKLLFFGSTNNFLFLTSTPQITFLMAPFNLIVHNFYLCLGRNYFRRIKSNVTGFFSSHYLDNWIAIVELCWGFV
jgi:hypothetical protein